MEAIAPVFGLIGTIMQLKGGEERSEASTQAATGQREAAEEAREISGRNAARIEAEGMEAARRERAAATATEATTRARVAASGVTMAGSPGLYVDRMSDEHTRQINWGKRATRSQADLELKRGDLAAKEGGAQADLTIAEGEYARTKSRAKAISDVGTAAGGLYSLMNL